MCKSLNIGWSVKRQLTRGLTFSHIQTYFDLNATVINRVAKGEIPHNEHIFHVVTMFSFLFNDYTLFHRDFYIPLNDGFKFFSVNVPFSRPME